MYINIYIYIIYIYIYIYIHDSNYCLHHRILVFYTFFRKIQRAISNLFQVLNWVKTSLPQKMFLNLN